MKRYFLVLTGWLFMLLVLTPGAAAGTTVGGPTGLIQVPTADILAPGEISLAYHRTANQGVGSLTYGIIDKLEAGLLIRDRRSDIGFHLKANLVAETRNMPGISVGLKDESYYMVVSKRLPGVGVRGHIGVGTGEIDGLFLGISKLVNPVTVNSGSSDIGIPTTILAAEYAGGGFNVGAEILMTPQFRLKLAAEDMRDLVIGVSFKFRM